MSGVTQAERDRELLRRMLDSCETIMAFTKGGKARFLQDPVMQSAVERHFELLGLAAKRLSLGLLETNPKVPWRSFVALAELLQRAVTPTDPEKLWAGIAGPLKDGLPLLRDLAA